MAQMFGTGEGCLGRGVWWGFSSFAGLLFSLSPRDRCLDGLESNPHYTAFGGVVLDAACCWRVQCLSCGGRHEVCGSACMAGAV